MKIQQKNLELKSARKSMAKYFKFDSVEYIFNLKFMEKLKFNLNGIYLCKIRIIHNLSEGFQIE